MRSTVAAVVVVVAAFAIAAVGLSGCSGERKSEAGRAPGASLDAELAATLEGYVREHHETPEEYIVTKFVDHEIVFVGEYHRIKHDVELIQNVIPLLYENGVYNLGMEFASRADQADIDRLVTAETYDEALANGIIWNQWAWWGYQEYVDIFRAAWEFNQELPESARPFRVFGLNATSDWSHVWTPEDRQDPEVMRKVWPEGNSDAVMAETILEQFVDKEQKALVYMGINHAYTEYRQPIYDESAGEFARFSKGRAGNRVYDEIGKRCITIFLHAPWPSAEGNSAPWVRAADGAIDVLMARLPPELGRAGFDVNGTPFGDLSGASSLWKHGYEDFTLATYCDGYIFQKPLSGYEGVAVVDGWFSEENRLDAIAQIANPDPRAKNRSRTVEGLTAGLASDTDISRHFGHLQ